jgi:seryl-tRNA synthetase
MEAPLDEFLAADAEWRRVKTEVDTMRAELQKASKQIGAMKARGEDASEAIERTKSLGDSIAASEQRVRELEARTHELELLLPNLPSDTTPDGQGEQDNVIVSEFGEKPRFDFEPLPHWDLCEKNGMLDFPRGAKLAGSGFILYTGWGARLEWALLSYMLDMHTKRHGYREIFVPFVVNRAAMTGTGQLPKFEFDMYRLPDDDLFLVPTAEVPLTNVYQGEILTADALPTKLCAYSACFRREAGAAGKDTRGLLRVHQFNKVELVKFTKPEDSYIELESLVNDARAVLEGLDLHFRTTLLCAPELGFSNAQCYDLEVWAPGVGKYLEVSSCSNFEAFQARRAQIRFRREQGAKPEYVHTLNASGVACPRLFAAFVETHQRPDGSIHVPSVLRPFLGVDRIPAG